MKVGPVEQNLLDRINSEGCVHLSLIDPENTTPKNVVPIAKSLEEYGTAGILVGGSTIASTSLVDEVVKAIKSSVNIPVILFPNNVTSISRYADAILFMSLLNSNNPLYITGFQALSAPVIKRYKIEPIPLAYLIIGERSTAAYIGQAHAIPYEALEIATGYAMAAEYLGMHFVYLEAGSGAKKPLSSGMISMVKKNITVPLIVGGGIRNRKSAEIVAETGADIIVTGTIIEDEKDGEKIRGLIEGIRDAGKHLKKDKSNL